MAPTLMIGIIVITGFLLGELAALVKLPKVTGYIVAGILLNPHLTHFIPSDFVDSTVRVHSGNTFVDVAEDLAGRFLDDIPPADQHPDLVGENARRLDRRRHR